MKIYKLILIATSLILVVGCSDKVRIEGNELSFPSSDGTSYLDACRDVIFTQGWVHVNEGGTTSGGETTVTMTGSSSEGKKVYFSIQHPADSKRSSLVIKTEDGFPLSVEQILNLVINEHDN